MPNCSRGNFDASENWYFSHLFEDVSILTFTQLNLWKKNIPTKSTNNYELHMSFLALRHFFFGIKEKKIFWSERLLKTPKMFFTSNVKCSLYDYTGFLGPESYKLCVSLCLSQQVCSGGMSTVELWVGPIALFHWHLVSLPVSHVCLICEYWHVFPASLVSLYFALEHGWSRTLLSLKWESSRANKAAVMVKTGFHLTNCMRSQWNDVWLSCI